MLLKVLLEINPIDQNRKIVALKKRRISIVWLFQISWKKSKISWWTTFFCSTSAGLVLDGSIDIFKLSTLLSAVDKLKQHHKKFHHENSMGMLGIELGAAGWEAQTLPLCYAAPEYYILYLGQAYPKLRVCNLCLWNRPQVVGGQHDTRFRTSLTGRSGIF